MKTRKMVLISLVLVLVALLSSCDQINSFIASRTRPLPVIQTFNSNLVETKNLKPNDTMFVQVQHLAPNSAYTVECLDPSNNLITMLTAFSDESGVISPSPI